MRVHACTCTLEETDVKDERYVFDPHELILDFFLVNDEDIEIKLNAWR